MPIPSDIAPIVQECFNRRDGTTLRSLWTDDFQFEGPVTSFAGKDRMLDQEHNLWTGFPDIRCEVAAFLASSDRVVLKTRLFGTHTGPFKMGGKTLEPTGRPIDFTLSVHMWFRGELIAGERVFYDTASFLRQLGLSNDAA